MLVLCVALLVTGCKDEPSADQPKKGSPTQPAAAPPAFPVKAPDFSGENAYNLVKQQVDFGPRVPGTDAHKKCREFLQAELSKYGKVEVQTAPAKTVDGKNFTLYNIIASFNSDKPNPIILSAHYDTRPWADQDDEDQNKPILGANDGGSGVAVLLEMARLFHLNPPPVRVDIVLFDIEDYGKDNPDTYCLGSQAWANMVKQKGYKARYGINLDMVGAADALFYKEGYSQANAGHVVDKIWKAANHIGYSSYFPFKEVNGVTDDHLFVMKATGIPYVDIIQYNDESGFGSFWHTHDDNMNAVHKNTLKAVGQTVMTVIYNEQ